MSRNSRSRALLVAMALALGVLWRAPSVSADHSWGYHWFRSINPLALTIGDNVTAAWSTYLGTAVSDWDASAVLRLTQADGATSARNCKPVAGRIEVCNSAYGFNGWLGIAQIWVSGGHITQATTRLNDSYFNTATYNTPAWRQFVACQEIGHTFGLDHQDEIFDNPNLGSCMDYTNDPGSNQHPDRHDFDELEVIYFHLDSAGSGGGSGRGRGAGQGQPLVIRPQFGAPQGEDPGDWGRLMRQRGRFALYDLDLDGGNHVFTFVVNVN